MSDSFYRAFEDVHRGSRELIKGRLVSYLPFVEPLLEIYPAAAAIDLGCGRGEWLELLSELGFNSLGVDLDAGMLESCLGLGLPVEQGEALAYLSRLPNDSQVIVSAFHVVEHIRFDQLQILVTEALRVLKPGGLLIMETPNPENIIVATCNFYMDPTHQRPIPPMLLTFVAEHAGFTRVKTLRLQESKELVSKGDLSMRDVFAGASPDYAVVAQKHAPDDVLKLTSAPFSADYGLSLENMLNRWDGRFDRLESKAEQAEVKAQQAESKAEQAQVKAQQATSKAEQAETQAQQAEVKIQQVEAVSNQALAQLHAVYASTSWSVTKPIRVMKRLLTGDSSDFGRLTAAIKLKTKQAFRPLAVAGMGYVNSKPALRNRLKRMVAKFPSLHQRLLRMAVNTDALNSAHLRASFKQRALSPELHNMTPRARRIYQDLKAEIEKNKGAV